MKQSKKDRKKLDLRRTFQNNKYMLGFILKACPGVFFLMLLSTVLEAVNSFLLDAYLYRYALNALQQGVEIRRIFITLSGILGFSLLRTVVYHFSRNYMELKQPRLQAYMQNLLQKKAAEADLACFENPDFYDTYVKASGETADRAYQVMNALMDIIWAVTYSGSILTLLVTIEPIFLLFILFPVLATVLIGKRRNRLRYEYNMKKQELARQRDYVRRTFYLKDFSKEMRLTQIWKVMFRRMHDSVEEMKAVVKEYGFRLTLFHYLPGFILDVAVYVGSIILAVYKTLVSKTMLLGDCFVTINSLINAAYGVSYLGDAFFRLDEHSLYIDNLRDFLNYPVKISEKADAPTVHGVESLALSHVSFRYGESSPWVLKDVSLNIKRGEKIAIVGHNGAGKTTLVKLLLRLYDPSEGELRLNGRDIRDFRLSSYRGLFGTVFQDYRLFAVTVAENVLLRGDVTGADRERVGDALEKSGMARKIASLPYEMDTVVTKEFDEKGAVFSGGEAQKLSIARVFVGNQEVVIMDEPTSALDPIAEQEMYQNMFAACQGKTVIFISHRLSSAAMADRVYLFENGEIAEQGPHGELLALNGKYADMWHKQADSYLNEEEELS